MSSREIPAFLFAATGSGSGKTSITIGIIRALRRKGYVVQPFKCGPDYLDPTYLELAAGRICYNLDDWMMGDTYIRRLFSEKCENADIAVIEGAMGLFDGTAATGEAGTAAHIAKTLNVPIILVLDIAGMGRTAAALVYGCVHFDSDIRIAGIIGNRAGSAAHIALIAESLELAQLPPLLGAVGKSALPELPSRHLGLTVANDGGIDGDTLDTIADVCVESIDLKPILPHKTERTTQKIDAANVLRTDFDVTVAVASDSAFCFVYPDNLSALKAAGAKIVTFSPVSDHRLPRADAVYFPGGYPELQAEALSRNQSLLQEVRTFHDAGGVLYAECGGLMYLAQELVDADGRGWPMCGVLPFSTRLRRRRKALRYSEVVLEKETPLGPRGRVFRGHQFHYSEIFQNRFEEQGWSMAYAVRHPRTGIIYPEGYMKKRTLASYVHLHWASCNGAAHHFVQFCRRTV